MRRIINKESGANVGIDPTQKQILVVKSMQHFYARFEPIAADILYMASPGALVPDMAAIPYQKARKTIWPLSGHQAAS